MTRYWLLLLLSLITILDAQGPTIRLLDHAAIEGSHVLLGQIASIEGSKQAERRQLASLVVADSPGMGRSKLVSAYRVRSLLQEEGVDRAEVLGQQCVVTLQSRLVPDKEIRQVVEEWLRERDDPFYETEVEYLHVPSQWEIPAGSATRLVVDHRKGNSWGPLNLTLQAQMGDKVMSSTRLRVVVHRYRPMVMVVKPLGRHEKIRPDQLEIRRADVTRLNGLEVGALQDAVGMVAGRDLPVGTLLVQSDLTAPTLIERGSHARITVHNGPVSLNIVGAEALQNGREGDHILFKNPMNARETLRAKVVAPGVALMELQPGTWR